MNSSQTEFVVIQGKGYPVRFLKPRDSWYWRKDNWLNTYQPSEDIVRYAKNVESRLMYLEKIAGHEYFQQDMADIYAKELQSSWEIEGESLDSFVLRSKIVSMLGLDVPEWSPQRQIVRDDRENAALDASLFLLNHASEINVSTLCQTHALLGVGEEDEELRMRFGALRTCGELVGRINKDVYEAVYEGPPPNMVPGLVNSFVQWWKDSRKNFPLPLGASLAHLFFVIIHPFHDGNGRMARLLMDKYLAHSEHASFRPVNIAATIRTHRTDTESTMEKRSAETGTSAPTLDSVKFAEDMEPMPNLRREPLLPYICISAAILGQKSTYYRDIAEASSAGNIENFVGTMLNFQHNAIEGAIARVPKLRELSEFFTAAKGKISKEERLILRNSHLLDGNFASKDTCIADIQDEIVAEAAWTHLKEAGLLNGLGKAVLNPALLDSLPPCEQKNNKNLDL